MIFVLPYTQRALVLDENCYLPLSVAYIDPDGVIQEIHDLQPQNTTWSSPHRTKSGSHLKPPQGWFERHKRAHRHDGAH